MDKVSKRLASLKKGLLSRARRVTLIRFVLSGTPIPYFSLFRALSDVCKNIEKLKHMHNNLWEAFGKGWKEVKWLHFVRW